MLHDLKTLWKIKRFRILLTARTLSNIGNGMSPIAMAFGVLSLPGSNASSLSWVTASHMVPIVLFLLLGGVVADRLGRARVVGVTDIIGSFVVATSGVLFLTDQATVPLLCVNAFVFGILNAMWWPAFAGLLPEVVPSEHLQAANSLVGLGANIGFTLGATMGAAIVSTAGPGWAIIGDGATFLVAGILVLQLQLPTKMQTGAIDKHPTMISQLRQGWSEFYSRKWIVVIVICFAFINMCFEGFLGVLAPVQMKEALGGARDMGLMLFAFGAGSVCGVLVSLRIKPKYPLIVAMGGMPIVGVWMLGAAVPLHIFSLMILAFFSGIALDLFFVMWMTMFQTHVPEEALSRVSAYDALGSTLFAPFGLFLAGPMAQWIGTSTTLYIAGTIAIVMAVGSLFNKDVRRLERVTATVDLPLTNVDQVKH